MDAASPTETPAEGAGGARSRPSAVRGCLQGTTYPPRVTFQWWSTYTEVCVCVWGDYKQKHLK